MDIVLVKMLRPHKGLQPGEQAGFPRQEIEALQQCGILEPLNTAPTDLDEEECITEDEQPTVKNTAVKAPPHNKMIHSNWKKGRHGK